MPRTRTTAPKKVKPIRRTTPEVVQEPVVPFERDVICRRCGEMLSQATIAMGICGDCLVRSQTDVRGVPSARYGHP